MPTYYMLGTSQACLICICTIHSVIFICHIDSPFDVYLRRQTQPVTTSRVLMPTMNKDSYCTKSHHIMIQSSSYSITSPRTMLQSSNSFRLREGTLQNTRGRNKRMLPRAQRWKTRRYMVPKTQNMHTLSQRNML